MAKIKIEIAYALPDKYFLQELVVEEGTNIEQAIIASKLLQKFSEIDLNQNKVGIFSRLAKLTDILQSGDRIEIYRPLQADPKEIRRKRALQQQQQAQAQKQAEKAEREAFKIQRRATNDSKENELSNQE